MFQVEPRKSRDILKVGTRRKRYDDICGIRENPASWWPRIVPVPIQSRKKAQVSQRFSQIVVSGDTLSLEKTVQRGVMDQMSGLTPIGKVGLSWLSLELVRAQASGQGVIGRGKPRALPQSRTFQLATPFGLSHKKRPRRRPARVAVI